VTDRACRLTICACASVCVFPEGPIDVMGGCRHSGKEAGIQSRGEQHKDSLILSGPFESMNRYSL
jgi:hypothetical protein